MRFAACLCLCGFFLCSAQPAKVVFERAAQALAAGDYAAAERGFDSVIHQEPRNAGALGNLGIIYSRTNRPAEAIAAYKRALQISPDDKAILLNLGLAYLKQEAHGRALPLFERVVAIDPHHYQARQLLALCRVYTGRLLPAIRDLEALRSANPDDQQVLFLLGLAYLKKGDAEAAKSTFDKMFALAGPARTQMFFGKASYEAALFPQAEESFLEVFRLDSDFPGVHLELGKVYITEHRADDAIRELQTALKKDPNDQEANYFLGSVLVQAGRFSEGVPYLERAKELNPESWAACFYLGKARLGLEQYTQAIELLQRSAALNPDEASVYYLLGRALKAAGRVTEANRAFRRVRELSDDPVNENRIPGIR